MYLFHMFICGNAVVKDLVLDGCGRAVLGGRGWRPVLKQGHGVGGVAQRRHLHLEHQLVDGETSVPPHLPGGCGHWNHLEQRHREAVCILCFFISYFVFFTKKCFKVLKHTHTQTLTWLSTDLPLASDTTYAVPFTGSLTGQVTGRARGL